MWFDDIYSSRTPEDDIYDVKYHDEDHEIYEDLCSLRRRTSVQVRGWPEEGMAEGVDEKGKKSWIELRQEEEGEGGRNAGVRYFNIQEMVERYQLRIINWDAKKVELEERKDLI